MRLFHLDLQNLTFDALIMIFKTSLMTFWSQFFKSYILWYWFENLTHIIPIKKRPKKVLLMLGLKFRRFLWFKLFKVISFDFLNQPNWPNLKWCLHFLKIAQKKLKVTFFILDLKLLSTWQYKRTAMLLTTILNKVTNWNLFFDSHKKKILNFYYFI